MGAEENDFFEKYNPLPQILDRKGGKVGSATDIALYVGTGLVALVALFAFAYFAMPSWGFGKGSVDTLIPEAEEPNYILGYSILSEDGQMLTNGTAKLDDLKDLSTETYLALSERVYSALSEMDVGKELEFNLSATEALGERDLSKIKEINRTEKVQRRAEITRAVIVSVADFEEEFGSKPEVNKTYNVQDVPWNYTVSSIEGDGVLVVQNAMVGQIVPISDIFFMSIAEVTKDTIITMLNAEPQVLELPTGNLTIAVNPTEIWMTLTPIVGKTITLGNNPLAKVVSYTLEKILVDYNGDYVGKNLILNIKMIEKKEQS